MVTASHSSKHGTALQVILFACLAALFMLPGAFIVTGCSTTGSEHASDDKKAAEDAATAAEAVAAKASPELAGKVGAEANRARAAANRATEAFNQSMDTSHAMTQDNLILFAKIRKERKNAEDALRAALAAATAGQSAADQKVFVDNVTQDLGLNPDQLNQLNQIQSQQIGGTDPIPPGGPGPIPPGGPGPGPGPGPLPPGGPGPLPGAP